MLTYLHLLSSCRHHHPYRPGCRISNPFPHTANKSAQYNRHSFPSKEKATHPQYRMSQMLPDQKLLSQSLLELKQLKSNRTPKVLCLNLAKHIKGSKECYLLGQKTNTQIFGVTPSIKLQNDTQTTVKQ